MKREKLDGEKSWYSNMQKVLPESAGRDLKALCSWMAGIMARSDVVGCNGVGPISFGLMYAPGYRYQSRI